MPKFILPFFNSTKMYRSYLITVECVHMGPAPAFRNFHCGEGVHLIKHYIGKAPPWRNGEWKFTFIGAQNEHIYLLWLSCPSSSDYPACIRNVRNSDENNRFKCYMNLIVYSFSNARMVNNKISWSLYPVRGTNKSNTTNNFVSWPLEREVICSPIQNHANPDIMKLSSTFPTDTWSDGFSGPHIAQYNTRPPVALYDSSHVYV